MVKLYNLYEKMKDEFKSASRLMTCNELYNSSMYRDEISNHLRELGFVCSSSMESTLFFSLVDIVVVVNPDSSFYYATLSSHKIEELLVYGRVIARKNDTSRLGLMLKANDDINVINDYLSRGKFHFLKLNRIESPSFYCDISTMNPYPSISNERVYSVDMISSYYWSLVRALSSGVYYVNDSAYTLVPSVGYCSNLNKCPMDCKIRMRTLSDSVESVYLWDINVFNRYYKSDKLEKLLSGVCRVGNDYVTLNRDVIERFYGSEYLHFESQGVRERYCLEELCDKSKDSDLRYYINKYKLYNDKKVCTCRSVYELQSLLRGRLKDTNKSDKSIRVRVLVNPQLIRCKHRSYYKTLLLDDVDLEVVHDIDSIMPSVYKIGASTKKGYCVLEVTAYSEDSALKIGVKDFDRQFGGIYDNKILGFQRGANICKNKHRVYNISLETQFKICEIMRWGYVEYFENYSKYIRSIIYSIDSEVDVSDDMIKLMFVNKVAKKSGKCKDVNLDVLGFELENFINILVTSSKDELEKMLLMERNNLSKRK